MPVEYTIFSDPTLVYIRYFGHVDPRDVMDALGRFSAEAQQYAGQPHFFDLSRVTSFDIDYEDFFRMLGQLADVYPLDSGEHLFVFYAPAGTPAKLADALRKPYTNSDNLIIRLAETRQEAFDILGNQRSDLVARIEAPA